MIDSKTMEIVNFWVEETRKTLILDMCNPMVQIL